MEQTEVDLPGPGAAHSDIMVFDGHWGGPTFAMYGHEAAEP
jgi:hypothetical protein